MDSAFKVLADLESRIGAAGFSMAEVCREAGISQAQVSRWRSKIYEPRLSSLQKLEDALKDMVKERGQFAGRVEAR